MENKDEKPPITNKLLDDKIIKTLFTKQKKFMGSYYKAVEIQEPVVLLMRRSGDVEFFEDQKKSILEFDHSDDTRRTIYLNQKRQIKLSFLNKTLRGYICHEDHPFPLPENPLLSTEEFSIVIEKTLNDIRKWKTEEIKARNETIKLIIYGLIALIGVYILYKLIVPNPQALAVAKDIAVNTTNNISKLIVNNTIDPQYITTL